MSCSDARLGGVPSYALYSTGIIGSKRRGYTDITRRYVCTRRGFAVPAGCHGHPARNGAFVSRLRSAASRCKSASSWDFAIFHDFHADRQLRRGNRCARCHAFFFILPNATGRCAIIVVSRETRFYHTPSARCINYAVRPTCFISPSRLPLALQTTRAAIPIKRIGSVIIRHICEVYRAFSGIDSARYRCCT